MFPSLSAALCDLLTSAKEIAVLVVSGPIHEKYRIQEEDRPYVLIPAETKRGSARPPPHPPRRLNDGNNGEEILEGRRH